MPKMKQQMHCLSKKNSVCGSRSKANMTSRSVLSTRKTLFVRRRRKRKIGVTLVTALKKQLSPINLCSETVTVVSPEQKLNNLVSKMDGNSDKYRPLSNKKSLSSSTYNSARCINADDADSYVNTTVSSCFSPIIIDNSSDADCSSVADTTNVYDTSAVSDICISEDVDYCDEKNPGITHGLG